MPRRTTCHMACAAGVAMDDLVYICTKIARQMEASGLDKMFDAAETATAAIEEARPLLENAVKLVDEVWRQSIYWQRECFLGVDSRPLLLWYISFLRCMLAVT